MPFLPLWFADRGVSPDGIGVLLALPILVRIAVAPPIMGLADRGVGPRAILAASGVGAALAYALMPAGAAAGLPALALAVTANATAQCALIPMTDYLTLAAVRRAPALDYARIRLWGSLSFLAANLAAGAVLTVLGGVGATVWLLAGLAGLTALAGWRTGVGPGEDAPARVAGARVPLPAALWLAMLAAAVVQASHSGFYAFGSLHWRGAGLSDAAVGALWATGVAAEIALFAAYGWSGRGLSRPFALIGLGAAVATARWIGLALAPPGVPGLAALQLLHGISFGATHLGTMAALAALAPAGARGRAQGLFGAASALAAAGATLAGGVAYRAGGGPPTFLLMAPVAALGLVLALAGASAARRFAPDPPHG